MARPTRSSGSFISYDLRPAKQSERSILVDLLKIGGDCGLPIRDYRYIGMGANRFYDYLVLHKSLGVRNMVSLEYDKAMFERAVFNIPFNFIEVKQKKTSEFFVEDSKETSEIVWLDYDGGLGPDIISDISSLGTRLKLNDFCFVTVSGAPPHFVAALKDTERLAELQEKLGPVAGGLTLEDVERANFADAVHKTLVAAFRNAFAMRQEGTFELLLQVEYSDSMPMVTVGGALLPQGTAVEFYSRMSKTLPFLPRKREQLYRIRSFHLTERERTLFDRAATSSRRRNPERTTLLRLGFKDAELDAYSELIRYVPRYVETAV